VGVVDLHFSLNINSLDIEECILTRVSTIDIKNR